MFCRNSVRWLYRLEHGYTWDSGYPVQETYVFYDSNGEIRLIIEPDGRISVTRGYAWNGTSPKVCFFDILLGTPDGVVHADTGRPKTYFASMVHDALYQFLREGSPYSRRDADRFFIMLMRESEFGPAPLYWLAVRFFGRLGWRGKQVRRHWKGSSVLLKDLEPATE